MVYGRKAHHCVLRAEVIDYEGTANSPRHIEQTVEKLVWQYCIGGLPQLT